MRELLNTLFVTTERSFLHLDHDTIRMDVESKKVAQMPLLHLGAIVCFGDVLLSTQLLHRCAEDGRSVVLLDRNGRFKARLEGPAHGNVFLQRAQNDAIADTTATLAIARNIVAGKIQNSRQLLLRGARETTNTADKARLATAAAALATGLERVERCTDIEALRGHEGDAARSYLGAFDAMIRVDRTQFFFRTRSRRPPLDRVNAMLSFMYTILTAECVSAAQGVGLHPQIGYLHVLRSGRPALGLDLVEEFRSVLVDRLVLSLINRRQIRIEHFIEHEGGAVYLNDEGRKVVLDEYQKHKQEETQHRVLNQKVPYGLLPHVQARLLARHLRGDVPDYLPFLYK
jgi:CRISP-associated protein Cas1